VGLVSGKMGNINLAPSSRGDYLSAMSMVKEFKEFISRGNVIDLAVGVIIGAAFGAIVTSLVADIIMPPIGYMMSGIDFSSLKAVIAPAAPATFNAMGKVEHPEVAIAYGSFINKVINFVIVSFVIFLVVKGVNSLKRKEAEKPAEPAAPTTDQQLLMEIRDLLAKKP
jgi:large conductance mechanosensitive channel